MKPEYYSLVLREDVTKCIEGADLTQEEATILNNQLYSSGYYWLRDRAREAQLRALKKIEEVSF